MIKINKSASCAARCPRAVTSRGRYDIKKDPYEQHNVASNLTAAQRTQLHQILTRLERCHTATTCWTAGLTGGA